MLKESQQWKIYVTGSAGCTHAEGPQVSPTTSGLGTVVFNQTWEDQCSKDKYSFVILCSL